MELELVTAGESHGPALVAILTGLPAGLTLEKATIDADLHRRQQGYGRSPRQQIERDEVEVLAGLRHGRTLGTPLALVVRNRDHANWDWGMSPWPPQGEPTGKGTKAVTLPRPGHADLAGALKYGLADVRDALERASARHTAVNVAAGAVAQALFATIRVSVAGSVVAVDRMRSRIDEARAEHDTTRPASEVWGADARTRRRRSSSDPTWRRSRRSRWWRRQPSPGSWRGRRARSSAATRWLISSPRTRRMSSASDGTERARPASRADRVHGRWEVVARTRGRR